MDPITILLLAAVVTKVVATHREDMEYARHGKDSPRYRMKLAKAQAARQSGAAVADPPRVGASGYVKDLWDDCWADLGEHRKRTRQARKDRQAVESTREWSRRSLNRREDGTPVDDMVDVAGVRPDDREPEWLTPHPDIEDGIADEPTSVVHDEHPYCLTPCGPTCTAPRRVAGHGWRCGTCGQDRAGFGTEADARADAAKHPCRPNPGAASPQELFEAAWKQLDDSPKTPADERDNSTTGGEHLATVIPLFPTSKEVTMNGTDTTGLSTAIAFAEQAASAHESFATAGTEGYTNALLQFEVGDNCVGLALAAQEASQLAAAKWREHLEALQSQLTVREAYQANPDAGNKQFVTGE